MRSIYSNFILFFIGAVGYGIIELAYRGYTHWSMMLTGGVCFFLLYRVFEELGSSCPLVVKGIFGAFFITVLEFYVGILVNLGMGWDVWDYSTMPHQFMGQICLFYTVAWFLLTIGVVVAHDCVQWIRKNLLQQKAWAE